MQRVLVAACAIAAALFLAAGNARAEDVTGKFGAGADTTLSGATGGSLRYGVAPKIDVQLLLHYEYLGGENDTSSSALALAILGHYAAIEWPGLAFDVFGGFSIIQTAEDDGVNDESGTDIGIEVGFGPNWWVTSNLSLNLGVGLLIFLDKEDPDDGFEGTRFELFGDPELVGSAGFTFWFR
jgi:hypothetical protein